jgi:hypothetical protein
MMNVRQGRSQEGLVNPPKRFEPKREHGVSTYTDVSVVSSCWTEVTCESPI